MTSGSVVLAKDEKNLIGISIGGGAPLCPCLYIVQVTLISHNIEVRTTDLRTGRMGE